MIRRNIPVLLYHHVNNIDDDPSLNVYPDVFEQQMKYLSEQGYATIFLDELIGYIYTGRVPKKTVAITFDDGYLDNWVYAYPVLKKYNLKATIFIITRNIKDTVRPHRPSRDERATGKVSRDNLPLLKNHFDTNSESVVNENGSAGFLSWEELREMERDGLIDIQSHSHSHGYYYVDERIVDFNRGQYWWLGWATDGDTRLGIPVYSSNPMLIARRYFDDEKLRDYIADYISKQGGKDYFENRKEDTWMGELKSLVDKYRTFNESCGRYEERDEKVSRIIKDLATSKELIEEKLNKKCKFLSYPAGKCDGELMQHVKKCRFSAAFTNQAGINSRGSDDMHLKRIIVTNDFERFKNNLSIYSNSLRLRVHHIESNLYRWKEKLLRGAPE